MKKLTSNVIPSLKIFQLVGDVKKFQDWLKRYHNKEVENRIFHGYKFFLECAFSQFFDSISIEDWLNIETDLVLQFAIGENVRIERLPNTCERIIFLKRIYNLYRPISKAKNISEIKLKLKTFQEEVIKPFNIISNECVKLSNSINRDKAINLLLISNLFINFNQIGNNGPISYTGTLIKNAGVNQNKLDTCLIGYNYTLQYVWYHLLGKKKFESTSLINIHNADSWREYTYSDSTPNNSEYLDIFGKYFILEDQTCLDSYFRRVQKEIIYPIEKKFKLNIIFDIENYFIINIKNYNKNYFQHLLSTKDQLDIYDELTSEEKLNIQLYWFPIEVFESNQLHNGIPAFITSLAGTVALSNDNSIFTKAVVSKFIHPVDNKKNDYSYGILIDSMAVAGHNYSGWLLYFDCCNDYSGFSNSEHKKAENIITEYIDKNMLELREQKIDKEIFKEYIAEHFYKHEGTSFSSKNIEQKKKILERESIFKDLKELLYETKGLVLELITFYIQVKKESKNYSKIDWNIKPTIGEIDVILRTSDQIKLIECKVNPDNCNLKKEIIKIKKKKRFFEDKENIKCNCEFWFWYYPNKVNEELLRIEGIIFKVLQKRDYKDLLLKGIDLSSIKKIMDFDL